MHSIPSAVLGAGRCTSAGPPFHLYGQRSRTHTVTQPLAEPEVRPAQSPGRSRAVEQNPDIRFLGRILGNIIRQYGGETLFRRIEYIRSTSVDRYRGLITDDTVDPGLGALSQDEALDFVRGFMLFSMLANLAEDRQGGATELGDDLAGAVEILGEQGMEPGGVAELLDHALIMPVLTAHPTEVRRKSMIDHRNRIADLMRMRDGGRSDTPDGEPVEEAIARQ